MLYNIVFVNRSTKCSLGANTMSSNKVGGLEGGSGISNVPIIANRGSGTVITKNRSCFGGVCGGTGGLDGNEGGSDFITNGVEGGGGGGATGGDGNSKNEGNTGTFLGEVSGGECRLSGGVGGGERDFNGGASGGAGVIESSCFLAVR